MQEAVSTLTGLDQLLARYGLESDLYTSLIAAVRSGDLCIDWDKEAPDDDRLVLRDGKLYLKVMDSLEESIAQAVILAIDERIEPLERPCDERLNEEQHLAFEMVLSQPISVIAGGPGTGKSFTIEALAKAFHGKRVLIAAPTGKAAMQLEARLGSDLAHFSTLHKAVGEGLAYTIPLDYDLVIIDESSMVDAGLFAKLFEARMENSRLVLVGDPAQLPPVECGHLFTEIAGLFAEFAPEKFTVLQRSLRAERRELIDLSEALLRGEMPKECFFTDDPNIFDRYAVSYASPEEAKKAVFDRVILCPLRRGPNGADAINARLAKAHVGRYVPVLLRQSSGELVNGEMGFGYLSDQGLKQLYFRGKCYEALDVEIAFCLSVHKAQGSEFGSVLLAMPKGSERLGRAVLYTAATRAKQSMIFFGERAIFQAALANVEKRNSGLKHRVQQARQKQPAASGRDTSARPRCSEFHPAFDKLS